MIIVKDQNKIIEYSDNLDTAKITHFQNTDDILSMTKLYRENTDRGFSKDRKYQYLGTISNMIWHKYKFRDPVEAAKWLETEEGSKYRITRQDTGRTGRIIIK